MLKRKQTIPTKGARLTDTGDLIASYAIATSAPAKRWFGTEVLRIAADAVRLERFNDGANVLFNHSHNEIRGVIERGSARVDADSVLRADVRITSATAAGREAIALVTADVMTKGSVGYRAIKVRETTKARDGRTHSRDLDGRAFEGVLTRFEEEGGDREQFQRSLDARFGRIERAADDEPLYELIEWEPVEYSLVSVPVDRNSAIARGGEGEGFENRSASGSGQSAALAAQHGDGNMDGEENATAGAGAEQQGGAAVQTRSMQQGGAPAAQSRGAQQGGGAAVIEASTAEQLERARVLALSRLAESNGIEARHLSDWIGRGLTATQAGEEVLRILEERGRNPAATPAALGMSRREVEQYSLLRAIEAAGSGNWNKAGRELEAHQAIAKRVGGIQEPNKFYVPLDVQARSVTEQVYAELLGKLGQRALDVATPASAGYLVDTRNMGFIEMMRARSVCFRMGARRLGGLVGNVTVPRQTGSATAQWLDGEDAELTETLQVLGQLSLTPKTVGAYTEISRQLMLQSSPDAESLVMADLAAVVGLAVDKAGLEGTGADGQPTGISATSGIGAVTGTTLGYAGVLEFQTDVAASNIMPVRGGYATTPAVAALMMARARFANTDTPLWQGNVWDGQMAGFPAMSSNQLASASMIFGDWDSLVIGEWGVLEVEVDPGANFKAGIIGVRAMYTVDVGVRRAAAFSRSTSIT